MQFTHIRLKNWKNFRVADVALHGRVFVIGANASGKSNFLDALRFLRDIANDGLRKAVERRDGVSALRCLSAGSNNKIEIEVAVEEDTSNQWRYHIVFLQDNNQRPKIVAETVWLNGEKLLSRPLAGTDDSDAELLTQTHLEQISVNRSFRKLASFFSTVSYQHLIPQAVRDPAGFTSSPVSNDPFGRDFLVRVWNTAANSREARLRKITEALKVALPQLNSLTSEMDSSGRPHLVANYSNWRAQGVTQRENQFSDGTLRLLGLMWTAFEGTGPLLIEEPELSLHTEVVRQIPAMFVKINRLRREASRQLFVSTHSEQLLSDRSIAPEEVLWLKPTGQGTSIETADSADIAAMKHGLTAADVFLPKSAPANAVQLPLAFAA